MTSFIKDLITDLKGDSLATDAAGKKDYRLKVMCLCAVGAVAAVLFLPSLWKLVALAPVAIIARKYQIIKKAEAKPPEVTAVAIVPVAEAAKA